MPTTTARTRPIRLRAEIFELTSNAGHTDVTIYLVNDDGDSLASTMLEFKGAGHKRRAAACLAAVTGAHEVLAAIRVLASVDMTTQSRCSIAVQFIDSMVERATVQAAKSGRAALLLGAVLAACDAAPVDGFTAPPAAGITSAASTDAPPAQHGTSSDETGDAPDADASSSSTGTSGSTGSSTGEPSTTTAAVDATTTSGGDDTTGADTTGEPDPSTTGADTTTADPSTGEASTGTGDESTGDASTTGGDTTTTTGDEGGSISTSSTGEPPPPLELPPECMGYTPLTDANRNVAFGIAGPKSCDAQLAPGWYRFMGAAGSRMPTTPPPIFSCGTHAGGYMNGKHPAADDGIVETTACFHWADNGKDYPCFGGPKPLKVLNCGEFFVYHLTPSAACMTRFCGEDV